MRVLILIFFSLFFSLNSLLAQRDTIWYQQQGGDHEFNTISLHPDKTFTFRHYNSNSCWTWYSVNGTWSKISSEIIFTDTIHWREDIIRIDTFVRKTRDYVSINVKDEVGNALPGVKVRYNLSWPDYGNSYITDENGRIRISKSVLANQKSKLTDQWVSFAIAFSNRKFPSYSMSTSFDSSYDEINIVIVGNPKEDVVIRTTTYRINLDEIYFKHQLYSKDKDLGIKNWGNFKCTSCK